jgi:hypothetical protein
MYIVIGINFHKIIYITTFLQIYRYLEIHGKELAFKHMGFKKLGFSRFIENKIYIRPKRFQTNSK